MPRLPKGLKTHQTKYYIPILLALSRMGASKKVKVGDLYEPVRLIMQKEFRLLNKYDFEDLEDNNRPEPRWMNTMRVARDEMVKAGYLEPLSRVGHGYWKMTDHGRQYLKEAQD